MTRTLQKARRPRFFGLLILGMAGVIGVAACSRSNPPVSVPAPPPAPPPPVVDEVDPFDTAENAYNRGLFVAAANAYNRALVPDSPTSNAERERARGRLALIHAMPDSPLYNLEIARAHLDELAERFPDSREGAAARTLIALQVQIADLERTVDQMESTAETLVTAIGDLEGLNSEQTTTIHALEGEVEQLQASLNATKAELETLREIDRQLRRRDD